MRLMGCGKSNGKLQLERNLVKELRENLALETKRREQVSSWEVEEADRSPQGRVPQEAQRSRPPQEGWGWSPPRQIRCEEVASPRSNKLMTAQDDHHTHADKIYILQ
eukprot:753561-Hanusia_phi.AAC.1